MRWIAGRHRDRVAESILDLTRAHLLVESDHHVELVGLAQRDDHEVSGGIGDSYPLGAYSPPLSRLTRPSAIAS